VDNENNKDFVMNITKVFGTILPQTNITGGSKSTPEASGIVVMESSSSAYEKKGEEEKIMEDLGISIEVEEPVAIRNRLTYCYTQCF